MKRFIALMFTVMMLSGMTLTANAAISPTAEPVAPSESVEISPKTSDSNVIVLGMMTVVMSAGMVAVSLRKSK